MLKYILLRLLAMIPLLFVVLFIVFSLGHLAPGDPVEMMYVNVTLEQSTITEEQKQEVRHRYGLDQPFFVQFGAYVQRLARGDFGDSITQSRPVLPMIMKVFPISAQLGLAALIMLVIVGIPLGILAALHQNHVGDYAIVGGSLFLRTVPVYVLAPLLLILLVLQLHIMDVPNGWHGLFTTNVLLPVFLLMLFPLAVVIRQLRASILEVLGNDYVRTARAKGLRERQVMVGHIMRNALTPVVTEFGLIVTGLITGSVFLETIFGIPGYGQLYVNALRQRDYPLILGCTILATLLVMVSNLVVDVIYPMLDPRVKL
jgi:ABC-type dipeptide/oligopeptide/nickel transport system permease component